MDSNSSRTQLTKIQSEEWLREPLVVSGTITHLVGGLDCGIWLESKRNGITVFIFFEKFLTLSPGIWVREHQVRECRDQLGGWYSRWAEKRECFRLWKEVALFERNLWKIIHSIGGQDEFKEWPKEGNNQEWFPDLCLQIWMDHSQRLGRAKREPVWIGWSCSELAS